jgi:hypothetical protein
MASRCELPLEEEEEEEKEKGDFPPGFLRHTDASN